MILCLRDPARHVVILSNLHLCHNPRVLKEATALAAAGYEVTVLGAWHDAELKRRDQALLERSAFRFRPVVDMTEPGIGVQFFRAAAKAASLAGRYGGRESLWQLGYVYPALRRAAWRSRGDLYVAHLEPALAVALDLARAGRRVAVDIEDWYSEDLLPEARRYRPLRLLRRLEGQLLRQARYATCPSAAMSRALGAAYGCRPPDVIYNAFPWSDRQRLDGVAKDRRQRHVPSICWFSQTLGRGRGLEDLLAALSWVRHPAEIHLRGRPIAELDGWLAARTPAEWRNRVFIHGLVANDELLSRIAEHDIGFAGEMRYCPNKELTVSNKMLQYLLAGLAVMASDTEGQREVAAQAEDAVLLYPSGNPRALAAQLDALLAEPTRLNRAKAAALQAARTTFCWERQEPVLLDRVSAALEGRLPSDRS